MEELRRQGLDEALRARVADGRAVLGICLGLQLALDWTEEDGGVEGLGILPGRSVRLAGRRVPRMGWAEVDGDGLLLRALLRRRDALRDRVVGGDRRRGPLGLVPRRPVPSREERRRRRPLPRPRAHGGEGAIPLPRLIPCLDVAAGRVVKGVRFQELRDVGDPVELGAAYSDRGADELVFLDVKATLEERETLVGVVRRVAEQLAIPFTVGGGIRTVADADALLSAGADKISINSAALASPSLITSLAEQARLAGGRRRDRHRGRPGAHAGPGRRETARGTVEWAREAEERGAGEILLTSIDSDGTRRGLRPRDHRARSPRRSSVPVIASGGAGEARHVAEALECRPGGAARLDPARGSGAARPRCARSCAGWG